jgi:hypothetical protein
MHAASDRRDSSATVATARLAVDAAEGARASPAEHPPVEVGDRLTPTLTAVVVFGFAMVSANHVEESS